MIVLAVALILAATLRPIGGEPGAGGPGCLGIPCTAGHLVAFALLGVPLALRFATSAVARRSPRRALAMLVLAIWLFAASTELAQGQIEGRDPDVRDWAADMLGAALGLAAGSVGLRWLFDRD